MKIISWNCNMAFRNKSSILHEFNPDIAIIQECESEETLKNKKFHVQYTNYIRFGKNKNKGLGVMTFNGYKAEILNHNKELEYIIPVRVFKDEIELIIFAVWTQLVNKDIYQSYVTQAARAFKYYNELLQHDNIIIAGDFNSNAIRDKSHPKESNHTEMVEILRHKEINSIYHEIKREKHGEEKTATLYFRKKKENPYHIDYFFCKKKILKYINSFSIGTYDKYISQSDHMPLLLTIEESFFRN